MSSCKSLFVLRSCFLFVCLVTVYLPFLFCTFTLPCMCFSSEDAQIWLDQNSRYIIYTSLYINLFEIKYSSDLNIFLENSHNQGTHRFGIGLDCLCRFLFCYIRWIWPFLSKGTQLVVCSWTCFAQTVQTADSLTIIKWSSTYPLSTYTV